MRSGNPPFEFDEIISDVRNNDNDGTFSCPICGEYSSDSVQSIQGHISGSRDELHDDLGWNYETEIRATADNR